MVALPELIEPIPITDEFVQGVAKIEQIGPCARFVLFTDQTMWEAGNIRARVIVKKIIIPIDALPYSIKQATDFLAMRAMNAVGNVFRLR